MASRNVPTTPEHKEQMAIARALQAERAPVKAPKQKRRSQGGPADRNLGGHHRATPFFGSYASASDENKLTSHPGPSTPLAASENRGISSAIRAGGGGGGGLNSSMWASSTGYSYVQLHMLGPGK
jgi:hypothetical protein